MIAQWIGEQIKTPETRMTTELKPTTRGYKGFGTTGIYQEEYFGARVPLW